MGVVSWAIDRHERKKREDEQKKALRERYASAGREMFQFYERSAGGGEGGAKKMNTIDWYKNLIQSLRKTVESRR